MPRSRKCIGAVLAFFLLAGLKPIVGQKSDPEFFIAVAPSVINVVQGELTSFTVTITCNTSSFAAVRDCNARPTFDFELSEFPDGTYEILLSDLNIGQPGDGFTVVSAMRRTHPHARTYLLTGYPERDARGIAPQLS